MWTTHIVLALPISSGQGGQHMYAYIDMNTNPNAKGLFFEFTISSELLSGFIQTKYNHYGIKTTKLKPSGVEKEK